MVAINQTNYKPKIKTVIKGAMLYFLPLSLILAILLMTVYYSNVNSNRKLLKTTESYSVALRQGIASRSLMTVAADLMVLSGDAQLNSYIRSGTLKDKELTAKEYLWFCQVKGLYDQIRYIDQNGMEIIRINYNQGKPSIVPKQQLRMKNDRYYFKEAIKLGRGEIFVSPMDLNVENNKIEKPLKPTVRFATPVFDQNGKKRGILITNYFGNILIQRVQGPERHSNSQVMLLDSKGYWLKSPNQQDEWGFMYSNKKSRTFANQYPEAWQRISKTDSGQFETSEGMFTYDTCYPLLGGDKRTGGIDSTVMYEQAFKQYRWKIVSRVPRHELNMMSRSLRIKLLLFWGILQLFLAVITWLMASAKASKALSQEIIRYQAYHDALTSLPNRKLFEDRLTMALAQAKRNKDLLAVMLFDLDSFKKVNDTLGHAQGDVLLQMVARRVGNCLRESDTLARLGGDEFTILLPQINSIEDAMVVASRIHDAFQTPFELSHSHVKTTTSLGIAIYPQDGEDIESLMKHADTAMYRVKEQGRNNFQIFSSMTTTSPSM